MIPSLFLFLLWELPAIIAMSYHKLFCTVRGHEPQLHFAGIWTYRLAGVFLIWPLAIALGTLASVSDTASIPGLLLIPITLGVVGWARFSR